jgi:hypothetical protein
MITRKKLFVVVMVLVLILVGACNSDPTLAPRNIRPEEDSSEESSSESTGELGTEGSATLSYTYKIEVPNNRVNLVQVDIPLKIEPDSDDESKYTVIGTANTTAYTQQQSGGAAVCFVQCDLPAIYIATGTVIQTALDQKGNCFISVNLIGNFEGVKPYGDCPEVINNNYKCILHQTDYIDPRTYTFSGDETVVTPSDLPTEITITAEISDVKIPPAIQDTCRWDE